MHQVAVYNSAPHGKAELQERSQQEQGRSETDGRQPVHPDGMAYQDRVADLRQSQADGS